MQDEFEMRLTTKICALLTEQFNDLKTMVFEKISNLTFKVEKLEQQIQTMDKKDRVCTQGNLQVIPHSSNLASEKTKPKMKPKIQTGPQKQKSGTQLSTKVNAPNPSSTVAPTSIASVASASSASTSESGSVINNGFSKVTTESRDGNDQENQAEWTVVERTKRGRTSLPGVLRGTAAPGTTSLRASEPWRYLHLYYVQEGTTVEQVRAHLQSICGDSDCTVEELKSRGRYSSFKLGVPLKMADRVMLPTNWAEDICVKPWRQNFRAKEKSA